MRPRCGRLLPIASDGCPVSKIRLDFEEDGSIRVKTETRPERVRLWQAHNPDARDFRLEAIGRAYSSSDLADHGDGVYVAQTSAPKQGWTAYFIELTFPGPGRDSFKFTTGVRVMPDTLPFGHPPEQSERNP